MTNIFCSEGTAMKTLATIFITLFTAITLLPLDAHAIAGLRIKCDKKGATVYLDEEKVGTCPGNFTSKAGRRLLKIEQMSPNIFSSDICFIFSQYIELINGEVYTVDATLNAGIQKDYFEFNNKKNLIGRLRSDCNFSIFIEHMKIK
jgi:hypothetical protein